jgi:hypothetical protein
MRVNRLRRAAALLDVHRAVYALEATAAAVARELDRRDETEGVQT